MQTQRSQQTGLVGDWICAAGSDVGRGGSKARVFVRERVGTVDPG